MEQSKRPVQVWVEKGLKEGGVARNEKTRKKGWGEGKDQEVRIADGSSNLRGKISNEKKKISG